MKSLERRIRKIEALLPQLPCPNPQHQTLRIFLYGVTQDQDRKNDELIQSIENCLYCKVSAATSKGPSIIKFGTFARGDSGITKNPRAPERMQEI